MTKRTHLTMTAHLSRCTRDVCHDRYPKTACGAVLPQGLSVSDDRAQVDCRLCLKLDALHST